MVHLEDTHIALRTVMAPVRLGPQAALAHADTAIFLALERQFDPSCRPCQKSLGCILFVKRSSFRLKVLVIEMSWLRRICLVFLNLLIYQISGKKLSKRKHLLLFCRSLERISISGLSFNGHSHDHTLGLCMSMSGFLFILLL